MYECWTGAGGPYFGGSPTRARNIYKCPPTHCPINFFQAKTLRRIKVNFLKYFFYLSIGWTPEECARPELFPLGRRWSSRNSRSPAHLFIGLQEVQLETVCHLNSASFAMIHLNCLLEFNFCCIPWIYFSISDVREPTPSNQHLLKVADSINRKLSFTIQ